MSSRSRAAVALEEWRKKMGLTQWACAAKVGVSQASWSDWEADKKRPNIESAVAIDAVTLGEVPVSLWVKRRRKKPTLVAATGSEG
jgi:DNA-binding XRE family transcriptional regulator